MSINPLSSLGGWFSSIAEGLSNKFSDNMANRGRKVVDLSSEQKKKLSPFFDNQDLLKSPHLDPGAREAAGTEEFAALEEQGWQREVDEDGNYTYSRNLTNEEKALQAIAAGGKVSIGGSQLEGEPTGIPSQPSVRYGPTRGMALPSMSMATPLKRGMSASDYEMAMRGLLAPQTPIRGPRPGGLV
tara:strand:+ start:31 stop:588 length:558 start_codon:yes stop_codon:yes gene_type:complete